MRVAMLKKTSADAKTCVVFFHRFFIDFSWKIEGKSFKTCENQLCAQKSSKNHVWNAFFLAGIPQGPQGPPGTTREIPEIAHFSHSWWIAPENDGGRPPGGLGRAPEVPPGAPRVRFCVDFWIDFAHQNQTKMNKKGWKTWKFLNVSNTYTSIIKWFKSFVIL